MNPTVKPFPLGSSIRWGKSLSEFYSEFISLSHLNQLPTTHMIILAWLLLCGIWGSTWLFIKLGLQDLPPMTFAGIRFLIASLILGSIIAIRRIEIPRGRREWQLIALVGFLGVALNYGLLFWGEQHVASGLAAVLHATIPLSGMVFAHHYVPAERITLPKIGGVLFGIGGLALIFFNQLEVQGSMALLATAGILLGAIGAAYCSVLVKARGQKISPITLSAGQMMCGFPPLLAIGIATEGNPLHYSWTPLALGSLFYLALVGSCIAFFLFFWLVKKIEVTKTMLIMLVTPLIAVTLGVLVNGEEFNWRLIAGGACIISGVGVVLLFKESKHEKTRVGNVSKIAEFVER
jgi:drug/metabolite transporter (DMT)-like permease